VPEMWRREIVAAGGPPGAAMSDLRLSKFPHGRHAAASHSLSLAGMVLGSLSRRHPHSGHERDATGPAKGMQLEPVPPAGLLEGAAGISIREGCPGMVGEDRERLGWDFEGVGARGEDGSAKKAPSGS
jgi:hypothetical protein